MDDNEVIQIILEYCRETYEKTGEGPSQREILTHLLKNHHISWSVGKLHSMFPGGMAEIYDQAGLPRKLLKQRLKRTQKAITKRMKSHAKDLEKIGKAGSVPPEKPPSRDLLPEELAKIDDPERKEILLAAQEAKTRADHAKALLDAKRAKEQAVEEALENEAKLDPEKIASYAEHVFAKSSLLDDLRLWCRKKGWSLEEACHRAFEWNEEETFDDAVEDDSELTFRDWVEQLISAWIEKGLRLPETIGKWGKIKVDGSCSKCGTRLEYNEDEEYKLTCPRGCEEYGRYVFVPCMVCKEMGYPEQQLFYNPDRNIFTCLGCGLERPVSGLPLKPTGTCKKQLNSMRSRLSPTAMQLIRERPEIEGVVLNSFSRYAREDQEQLAAQLRLQVKRMPLSEVSKFIEKYAPEAVTALKVLGQIQGKVADANGTLQFYESKIEETKRQQAEEEKRLMESRSRTDREIAEYRRKKQEAFNAEARILDTELTSKRREVEAEEAKLKKAKEYNAETEKIFAEKLEEPKRIVAQLAQEVTGYKEEIEILRKYVGPRGSVTDLVHRLEEERQQIAEKDRQLNEVALCVCGKWLNQQEAYAILSEGEKRVMDKVEGVCRFAREQIEDKIKTAGRAFELRSFLEDPFRYPEKSIRELSAFIDEVHVAREHGVPLNVDADIPARGKKLLGAFPTEEECRRFHDEKMRERREQREAHIRTIREDRRKAASIEKWGQVGDRVFDGLVKPLVEAYLNPRKATPKNSG